MARNRSWRDLLTGGDDAPLRETPSGAYKSNLPPAPGDELSADEWIRRREGRPSREEEEAKRWDEEKQKAKIQLMKAQQRAMIEEMRNAFGQSSYPFVTSTAPFPSGIFRDPVPPPKRSAKPKTPAETPEEAERRLTEVGRRKIIVDEDK